MNILWLSRHAPQEEQYRALEQAFAPEPIRLIEVNKTVQSADEVINTMSDNGADELVAVLPINLIADLTHKGVHPIRAVMNRELKDDGQVEFTFDHFERVDKVEIVTSPI